MDKVREALEPLARICATHEALFNGNLSANASVLVPMSDLRRASAALASLPASDAGGWRPIETAENFDRVIVAGWQPRNGNTAGYWWYHEDCTDECGRPMYHPDALLWHPFPAVPSAPPAPPRSLPTGGDDA